MRKGQLRHHVCHTCSVCVRQQGERSFEFVYGKSWNLNDCCFYRYYLKADSWQILVMCLGSLSYVNPFVLPNEQEHQEHVCHA